MVLFSIGNFTGLKPFELELFIIGEYIKNFILRSIIIGTKPSFNISIIRFNKLIIVKEEYIGLLILFKEFKRLSSI